MLDFIKNDTIISAEKYFESSYIKQKERVIQYIQAAFSGTSPVVCLPFETYEELDEELARSGWVYDEEASDEDEAVYYPIWNVKSDESVEKYKENEMPSARMFYENVMRNQWNYLKKKIESALANGEAEIRLPFDVYADIREKMNERHWVYDTWEPQTQNTKKCAIFFPS